MGILDALYAGFRLTKAGVPTSSEGVATLDIRDIPQGDGTSISYDTATRTHTLNLAPRIPQAHPSVYCVALANIPTATSFSYSAAQWDGQALASGRRVLLTRQSDPTQNGIWTAQPVDAGQWQLFRPSYVFGGYTVAGSMVLIEKGEVFGGSVFVQKNRGAGNDGLGDAYLGSISSSDAQLWRAINGPDYAPPLTTLAASGASASWVTLENIPKPPNGHILDVAVLGSAINPATGAVTVENFTARYKAASNSLSLIELNPVFESPMIATSIDMSLTSINVQAQRQAAGGGDITFRVEIWTQERRAW